MHLRSFKRSEQRSERNKKKPNYWSRLTWVVTSTKHRRLKWIWAKIYLALYVPWNPKVHLLLYKVCKWEVFSSTSLCCVCLGNVLIDRYKSLQRRNMVEPRVRQRVVLKYKHKVFTKRSHMEPKGVKVGKKPDAELPNDDTSLWLWRCAIK